MTAPKPDPLVVSVPAGTRLEQLFAEYETFKPVVDAAQARLKEVTDAIKYEAKEAHPEAPDILLTSTELTQPLRLHAVPTNSLDTKRLKADLPAVYAHYLRPGTTWKLERR